MTSIVKFASCLCLLPALLQASVAQATIFILDTPNSNLTLSMSVGGNGFSPQPIGANVTSYFGAIDASLSSLFNPAATITFNALGTNITANNNLSSAPGSNSANRTIPAPANYGLNGVLGPNPTDVAFHDLTLNLTGNAGSQNFNFSQGYFDVLIANLVYQPNNSMVGAAGTNANTATYAPNGDGSGVLTIPVNITFTRTINGSGATMNLTGTLRGVSAVPEPGSGLLLAGTLLGLAGWRRRRSV